MKIKSVSQNLFRQFDSKLSVKLVVPLIGANNVDGFYSIYESDKGNYLTLSITPYIVFQYKNKGPFDKSQTVRIGEMDMLDLIRGLGIFEKKLNRADLFTYYKSGDITCEPRRDDTITISFKSGDFLKFEPGVILNTDGSPLPGVYLYLNMDENKTELSLDEFDFLYYKISRMDLNAQGLQLIQTRLAMEQYLDQNKKTATEESSVNNTPVRNIYQKSIYQKQVNENPVDNRRANYQSPSSLDDISKGFGDI